MSGPLTIPESCFVRKLLVKRFLFGRAKDYLEKNRPQSWSISWQKFFERDFVVSRTEGGKLLLGGTYEFSASEGPRKGLEEFFALIKSWASRFEGPIACEKGVPGPDAEMQGQVRLEEFPKMKTDSRVKSEAKMNTRLILSITAGAVLFALASSAQGMSGTSGAASPGGSSFALGERVKDYGRKLGEALKKADRKREASGLQSVMPSRNTEGMRSDDASLVGAKTGVEYFSRLLDLEHKDAPGWKPFAKDVKAEWLTGNDAKALDGASLLWSVASDASEVDGNVPILVTANFDCSKIPAAWDGETDADKVIKLNASPAPLGMGLGLVGMVLVRKNGEVEYLPASKVTLRNLCKGKAMRFSPEYAEYPLSYLAPTRRVAIQKE